MSEIEFRAYDSKQKTMIYNKDSWLPMSLKKFGHTEYPVHISDQGVHYTLDCLSNHYENDWEEDVVTRHGIELMQFTNYRSVAEPQRKIYANDIISFFVHGNLTYPDAAKTTGRVIYNHQLSEWIVVDKEEQFLAKLSVAEQPHVIGNWFDTPELLK